MPFQFELLVPDPLLLREKFPLNKSHEQTHRFVERHIIQPSGHNGTVSPQTKNMQIHLLCDCFYLSEEFIIPGTSYNFFLVVSSFFASVPELSTDISDVTYMSARS